MDSTGSPASRNRPLGTLDGTAEVFRSILAHLASGVA
jgi:hypothetical protein